MPEAPDIDAYIAALEIRVIGKPIEAVRLASPFLLRTVEPPLEQCLDRRVRELRRVGKRIAVGLEGDLWLVLHLMIAGRLHWKRRGAKPPGKVGLAAFDFPGGTLTLTEAGAKRRASLHVARGEEGLARLDPGGAELERIDAAAFGEILRRENHTLKRALTDPTLLAGIGNAYSDEILHAARLSPVKLTRALSDDEVERLFAAARSTLRAWTARLGAAALKSFPEGVTAFREGMAAHGRAGRPCPVCGSPIQQIRRAESETNYCPTCQTGGRLLADRALSRLLKRDWPRTLDELEARKARREP